MTTEEMENKIKKIKKFTKKLALSSKSASKKFLIKAGICDEEGNLKEYYKS